MLQHKKISKVAIIIRAGRPNYRNTVENLIKSLDKFWHFNKYELNLYISVDSCFERKMLSREGFKLKKGIGSKFKSVHHIFDEDREANILMMNRYGIASLKILKILLLQKPYGYQINNALIEAILDGNEIALHFDDDVGFAVPIKSSQTSLKWIYMDVVGWHIKGLERGATVTVGPVAGLRSPIPLQIKTVIPEWIRKGLGELFEQSTEFLDENAFLCPRPKILSKCESKKDTLVNVKGCRGYRWTFPSSMGINLRLPFPAFYNPADARGEDAFFSMALNPQDTIFQIPAYIFHDPFLSYPEIYEDKYPKYLTSEPLSPEIINRFANAALGWIKYMPLFLRIRFHDNPKYRKQVLKKNYQIINKLSAELAKRLRCNQFLEMSAALDIYQQRVEIDFENWIESNLIWKKSILPWLHKHPNFNHQ